jgi:hypothetical protein
MSDHRTEPQQPDPMLGPSPVGVAVRNWVKVVEWDRYCLEYAKRNSQSFTPNFGSVLTEPDWVDPLPETLFWRPLRRLP